MSRSAIMAVLAWGFLIIVLVAWPLWRERRINRKADRWLRAMDDIDVERERMEHDRLVLVGGRSYGPGPGLERDSFDDDPLAYLDESLPDPRWRR